MAGRPPSRPLSRHSTRRLTFPAKLNGDSSSLLLLLALLYVVRIVVRGGRRRRSSFLFAPAGPSTQCDFCRRVKKKLQFNSFIMANAAIKCGRRHVSHSQSRIGKGKRAIEDFSRHPASYRRKQTESPFAAGCSLAPTDSLKPNPTLPTRTGGQG